MLRGRYCNSCQVVMQTGCLISRGVVRREGVVAWGVGVRGAAIALRTADARPWKNRSNMKIESYNVVHYPKITYFCIGFILQ